ncbi:transmembrane protein 150A [Scyliorhinus canicula]|uniref:transmembrane protein 150A n=1 Tax=Scyliorhinus canicula TaxID=7830 RepID=UPI0018F6025F|nr:transmembrane protein 150A [Scyliorhinus canicula]XP_038638976.1 transmembrane protein 150A [Scyliorhinus canicula]
MTAWLILPVCLSVSTITALWVVYAVAVRNHHVCPVDNWTYNESCGEVWVYGERKECCTLNDIPLVSKCGTLPPESCLFSLICSVGSFMVMLVGLLRYAQVLERHQNSLLNTAALVTCWICAAGLVVVGNFQVDNARVLHYVGAGVGFPSSMLFICFQSVLTYRMAKNSLDYRIGHCRTFLTLVAFMNLVLSGVFFIQESSQLQHAAAICEWIFTLVILIFYGTFAVEFGSITQNTFLEMLAKKDKRSHCKSDNNMVPSSGVNRAQEAISMI